MGLCYYYKLGAPKTVSAKELEEFLRSVESEAQRMSFSPTFILNGPFDTDERQKLARRITTGLRVSSPKLKGVGLRDSSRVWFHDQEMGECRVIPDWGVLLVLTDEHDQETVFGFLLYPDALSDKAGSILLELPTKGRWVFDGFLKNPDLRYRRIVRLFGDAHFLEKEQDDFALSR